MKQVGTERFVFVMPAARYGKSIAMHLGDFEKVIAALNQFGANIEEAAIELQKFAEIITRNHRVFPSDLRGLAIDVRPNLELKSHKDRDTKPFYRRGRYE